MDADMFQDIDFSQPLHFALSQLQGPPDEEQQQQNSIQYMKPADLSSMCDEGDNEEFPPATTEEIIDDFVEKLDNYPKLVMALMKRGLLRKKQACRKCDKVMHLRRRKNAYEWRCRTRDKKRDCSSCSIKAGSWFELTKQPFKTMFNFLTMHCKNCSPGHIASQLKLSVHTVNDIRKVMFELADRIHQRYPPIGGENKRVYLELMTVGPQKNNGYSPEFKVLAGQELESRKCFVQLLPDDTPATLDGYKTEFVARNSAVTMVVTAPLQNLSYANQSAKYLDETTLYPPNAFQPDLFFTNLRKPIPEHFCQNFQFLQLYLNDQVVRRTEGSKYLERCVEEIMSFTV
ncbi:unnamed protein product [Caenorhabditis sp. 36 PRJEB53466]|nr:unnamed protein product [Caenorhabditis sp. 36 PRJEB53466]